ncbi:MAG TPA: ATP-binding protein [Baekduia sp.]
MELERLFGPSAPVVARAFDQFPDGVAAYATAGGAPGAPLRCVYVNAAGDAALAEVIGARLRDADAEPPCDLALEHGGARLELRAVPMGDGVLVTFRDVTAMCRGEDAAERMAAIVRSTEDAIVSVDRDGRITHWNRGAERLVGWSAEAILGHSVRRLVRAEDMPDQSARFQRTLSGRSVERIETRWVRQDRTLVDVRLTASPLRDRDGGVVGVTAVVHDITRSKRIEAELRRSNAELERFAAVAAHDLRTPAITLVHLARLLAAAPDRAPDREALADRVRQLAALAESAATHAQRLVDGLAEYARTAHTPPASEAVDLGALAGDVVAALGPELEATGATVEVAPLPSVLGDPGGLSRVLQNLLVNAIKYRGDAAPVVRIDAERDDGAWTVAVADNGQGVTERDRRRIFDIFARAHAEDAVEGSGLGLAVCQTIVEHHGGRIWVEPAAGGGSVFRFTLPERMLADEPAR